MSLSDATAVDYLIRNVPWVRDVEQMADQVYRFSYLNADEEGGRLPVAMFLDGNLVSSMWTLLAPVDDVSVALTVTGTFPAGLTVLQGSQGFLRFSLWKEWSEPLALTNGISVVGLAHNLYQQTLGAG